MKENPKYNITHEELKKRWETLSKLPNAPSQRPLLPNYKQIKDKRFKYHDNYTMSTKWEHVQAYLDEYMA
jgi:hypothetical protein